MEPQNNEDAIEIAPEDTKVIQEDGVSVLHPDAPNDTKMSFGGIMRALKSAIAGGNLTAQQAANIRRDMGISNSFFTRKKVNPSKRKRINKLAKTARKVNARAGHKGQKMTKGKR